MENEWFENWFDSEYYHILYKHRDHDEAERFISNILKYLNPVADSTFLDLACGKGRHSLFLAEKGFQVMGTDLSLNSITEASKHKSSKLSFWRMDMRDQIQLPLFDYVFNLFTSFGYFADEIDNLNVLKSVYLNLKPNGKLLIDFLNSNFVLANLVKEEDKTIDGIKFEITRAVEEGKVVKRIQVHANSKSLQFEERVQLIDLPKFKQMFEAVGFNLLETFGNYDLDAHSEGSDRLILLAQKK